MYETCNDRAAANAVAKLGKIAVLFFRGQTHIVFPGEYATTSDKRLKKLMELVYPRDAEQFTGKFWREDLQMEGYVDLEVPTCLLPGEAFPDDRDLRTFLCELESPDYACVRLLLAAHVRSDVQGIIDMLVRCSGTFDRDQDFRDEIAAFVPPYVLTAAFEYARTSDERVTIAKYLSVADVR